MNKKGISTILLIGVIVAVVVVGAVAYWAYTNYGAPSPTPTPAPTPTPTPAATIDTATSLGFKVDAYGEQYAFTAKNLGGSNILLRVDETDAQNTNFIYVFNQAEETVWASIAGSWMDVSADFDSYWSGANSAIIGYTAFENYKTELAENWSGSGAYDYTSGTEAIHIYDIVLNPNPADSFFEHG
jgi:hypothetical protein